MSGFGWSHQVLCEAWVSRLLGVPAVRCLLALPVRKSSHSGVVTTGSLRIEAVSSCPQFALTHDAPVPPAPRNTHRNSAVWRHPSAGSWEHSACSQSSSDTDGDVHNASPTPSPRLCIFIFIDWVSRIGRDHRSPRVLT